ncbi:guanylate cyclase 32E-like, partial [Haemaphysalis longicornis]
LFREEADPAVVRAFRSYLGIVGSPASGFEEFAVAVNEYIQRPPFNIVNAADTIGGRKKIPSEGAYLYDAVMVYARALNACLAHGGDLRNGKHLFEHMRGRSYQSAMGYMVRMDHNGDAEGNYTLIARKGNGQKDGAFGLFPVGVFELSGNGSELPILNLFDTIDWINGMPPKDEPPCGFSGEKCILHLPCASCAMAVDLTLNTVLRHRTDLDMDLQENRLASFAQWPLTGNIKCTPEKMAEAGFYHCPTENEPDLARCYVCFKEMFRWEPDDDPVEQHSRSTGSALVQHCAFVQLGKKERDMTRLDYMTLQFERAMNRPRKLYEVREAEIQRQLREARHELDEVIQKYWAHEQALDRLLWKVDFHDIQMGGGGTHAVAVKVPSSASYGAGSGGQAESSNGDGSSQTGGLAPVPTASSQLSLSLQPDFRYSHQLYAPVGVYRGRLCAVKRIRRRSPLVITRGIKMHLNMLRELRHDNLCSFVGVCVEPPNVCVVSEYCSRGSLRDLLKNEHIKLDAMFVASLVADLVRGMVYLHESPLRSHGDLRSANCLVDSRWVLKVADFGLAQLKHNANDETLHRQGDRPKPCRDHRLLWRAPELLRDPDGPPEGTPCGDVYSFAIVLSETLARAGPFGKTNLNPTEIVERVRHPPPVESRKCPFRPPLSQLPEPWDADYVRALLSDCWAEAPEQRPDFKAVRARLRPMRRGLKPSIVDNMLAMMETYATNLEALVDQRTDQLAQEKRRADALLYEILPRTVADQLKRGRRVEAESFDSVTIYFSDIVGFTRLSAQSTAMEVVELLNELYTCFDAVIDHYAVYKVETIGDAYMVVGGLARHPRVAHASQVASMALHLLRRVRHFRIRHRPQERLMLRVGLHSGPVCAGVVGSKMPRYCLFGDTVNTASRMESTGTPLKIHCSESCKMLLEKAGGYILEERGLVYIKGKGDMRTYWLEGRAPGVRCRSSNGFQQCDTSAPTHDIQCTEGRHSCPDLGAPPWQGIS